MRTRRVVGVSLLLGLVLAPLLGRAGEVKETQDLLARTRVGIPAALDAARIAAPGSAVSVRLVRGEEGPAWRVLVLRGEELADVRVDARTGHATLAGTVRDESEAEKARSPRAGD